MRVILEYTRKDKVEIPTLHEQNTEAGMTVAVCNVMEELGIPAISEGNEAQI